MKRKPITFEMKRMKTLITRRREDENIFEYGNKNFNRLHLMLCFFRCFIKNIQSALRMKLYWWLLWFRFLYCVKIDKHFFFLKVNEKILSDAHVWKDILKDIRLRWMSDRHLKINWESLWRIQGMKTKNLKIFDQSSKTLKSTMTIKLDKRHSHWHLDNFNANLKPTKAMMNVTLIKSPWEKARAK